LHNNYRRADNVQVSHLVYTLRLLAEAQKTKSHQRDHLELVWTGPENSSSESRDTKVVVQELFETAQHHIFIASYALEKGEKASLIFEPLARKMDKNPNLAVQMCLNVHRPYRQNIDSSSLLLKFVQQFRQQVWTGIRYPDVYYDTRSLINNTEQHSCLHAKCVIVDFFKVLVTSANFTVAAHQRNIEAGVLIEDALFANSLYSQFNTLIQLNILKHLPEL
jgi:phosphatidylserine/phosphatidylglycerophosphate/cardiolipin synthase-like enzyme